MITRLGLIKRARPSVLARFLSSEPLQPLGTSNLQSKLPLSQAGELNTEANTFSSYIPDEGDITNLVGALKPNISTEIPGVLSQLSSLNPFSLYFKLDGICQSTALFLSDNMGLGMGVAIAIISASLKLFFTPVQLRMQTQGKKMRLLQPEMTELQNRMKSLSRNGKFQEAQEERAKIGQLQKKHGINNWIAVFGMVQFPFLITWFLSLRHMAMNPDLFPKMTTDGFLWFKNLSEYDPFFILPLASAYLSSLNINRSPMVTGTVASATPLGRFVRFAKFMPFFGFPILMFFPAAMNLHWVIFAGLQLALTVFAESKTYKRWSGVQDYLPGTIMERSHLAKVQKEDALNREIARKTAERLQAQKLWKEFVSMQKEGKNVRFSDILNNRRQQNPEKFVADVVKNEPVSKPKEVVEQPKAEFEEEDGKLKVKSAKGRTTVLYTNNPKASKKKAEK